MSEQKPNGADTDPFAGMSEAGTTSSRTPYADIEAAMQFGYGDGITLDPLPIKYKCRKPNSRTAEYIRCHPDRTLWQQTTVLEDQQGYDKAVYLVHPHARVALQRFLKHVLLVPAINTEDEVFVWYIPISDVSQGRRGRRSVELSARRVAESAISEWKAAHFQDGEWVGQTARGDLGEPNWPEDLTTRAINERTFADSVILDDTHEIAQVYLGVTRR
jgi:hypothetical protein